MSSSKEFVQFIQEQLDSLDPILIRPMMGEYLVYYQGKVIGGIYNDRLLIKNIPSAVACFAEPVFEIPYPGAKEMLLVEDLDQREFLCHLFNSVVDDLPLPKKRKKKTASSDS